MNTSLPCNHGRHTRCAGVIVAGPEHLAWGCTIGCACLCHLGLRPGEKRLAIENAVVIYLPAPPTHDPELAVTQAVARGQSGPD